MVYLYLSAPALWCYSVVECIKRYLLSQARFLLACHSHPPPYQRSPHAWLNVRPGPLAGIGTSTSAPGCYSVMK